MARNRGVVLVVDDDATMRNIVALFLERQGFQVLSARDGQEALALSRRYSKTIDLTVTVQRNGHGLPPAGGTARNQDPHDVK